MQVKPIHFEEKKRLLEAAYGTAKDDGLVVSKSSLCCKCQLIAVPTDLAVCIAFKYEDVKSRSAGRSERQRKDWERYIPSHH